ncbi:hypothetical protein CCDG5_1255 [[Clostridium] cellulosi]|uniref:Uncharacterized protein n=1 Tax=[Clostridium] cellulosi TaxID=29343 RepID=A0A078KTH2_9FIRM|nr:hypothetical protein CCDG5_1255 [[Clostridium] cellulosi]
MEDSGGLRSSYSRLCNPYILKFSIRANGLQVKTEIKCRIWYLVSVLKLNSSREGELLQKDISLIFIDGKAS